MNPFLASAIRCKTGTLIAVPNPRHLLLRVAMLMLVLASFYAPTVASTSHASSEAHPGNSSATAPSATHLVSSYIVSHSREYVRDAFGRVVGEKDETGDTTWFGHDGMHRVIQSDPGPDSYFYTINGTDPDNHYLRISARNLKQRLYYHQDRLGSVVGVTSQRQPSAQPTVEEWNRFEAYGNITRYDGRGDILSESAVANRFGFQGQLHDQSVGLVNMRARMYSPELGRFLSRDPTGLAGGSNQFAFVGGSPLSYTDPTGLAKKNREALSAGNIIFRLERDGPMGIVAKKVLLGLKNPNEGHWLGNAWRSRRGWGPAPGPQSLGSLLRSGPPGMPQHPAKALVDGLGRSIADGYKSDGVLGAVNAVNPAYNALTQGYEAKEAYDRGDNWSALQHGAMSLLNAWGTVAIARAAATGASAIAPKGGAPINVNRPGGGPNCGNCAIATDATIAGRPASGLPQTKGMYLSTMARHFGTRWGRRTTIGSIARKLQVAGPGTRGIVFGNRGAGKLGHYFNAVVNKRGVVKFVDGQSGTAANLADGFIDFRFLPTN